jgi:hypothetical protein
VLVVEPVTLQPDTDDRQLGLFGGTSCTSGAGPNRHYPGSEGQAGSRGWRGESNDVDLMHTVAANAVRCGYLLVGGNERVYTRTTGDEVARVPRYEEDAVHQLLRRRWLTLGTPHRITCGAASLVGTTVLVPRDTRARITRWAHLQRPPSWPAPPASGGPAVGGSSSGGAASGARSGRVIDLDRHRRRR